jgi:hypothetical protein
MNESIPIGLKGYRSPKNGQTLPRMGRYAILGRPGWSLLESYSYEWAPGRIVTISVTPEQARVISITEVTDGAGRVRAISEDNMNPDINLGSP